MTYITDRPSRNAKATNVISYGAIERSDGAVTNDKSATVKSRLFESLRNAQVMCPDAEAESLHRPNDR